MIREQQPALSLLAIGLIVLGVLNVIYRDFAFSFQPVPPFHPGRDVLAVACGLFMVAVSVALLFRSTAAIAVRALFACLVIWQCLFIPDLLVAPRQEASWLEFGETAILLAGGWALFACLSGLEESAFFKHFTGERGLRIAQILFGLALLPVGLSHFVYVDLTIVLVPSWLPFHTAFAYLTGAGQIACGLGVLLWILPRAAAFIEAGMLALFTFMVWGPNSWFAATPKLPGTPAGVRFALTAFLFTWIVGAAALAVATNIDSNRNPWRRSSRQHVHKADAARPETPASR